MQFPLSPLLPTYSLLPVSYRFTPFLSLPRKEQTSQGHQPNMAQQDTARLRINAHIEVGQGNQLGGKGEQAKEPKTPDSTVRNPLKTPN